MIIENAGYPVETHISTTDDGYILTIHRIPHGKDGPTGPRPVVFVQHGLLCSSADWVLSYPTKALGIFEGYHCNKFDTYYDSMCKCICDLIILLAFILSDAGYDVWLGNYRGNTYSRAHLHFDPDTDLDYWQFRYRL